MTSCPYARQMMGGKRNTRKGKKNMMGGEAPPGMKQNSMMGGKRKSKKNMTGGKRKLSTGARTWTRKVTDLYHKMKKQDARVQFKDALKRASQMRKRGEL